MVVPVASADCRLSTKESPQICGPLHTIAIRLNKPGMGHAQLLLRIAVPKPVEHDTSCISRLQLTESTAAARQEPKPAVQMCPDHGPNTGTELFIGHAAVE